MRRTRTILILVAVAAVLAAGCAGEDEDKGEAAVAPAAASSTSRGSASGDADTDDVRIADFAFVPRTVSAKVGQKVKWVNEDSVDHNVTAQSGADFKSDNFGKGGSFEFTADKAGTIQYVCTIHPGMTATLNVTG